MIRSVAPPDSMCRGVITITEIIAACALASPTIAASAAGRSASTARTRCHEVPVGRPAAGSAAAAACRASSSGSGRSSTCTTTAATSIEAAPTANGPVSTGRPTASAARPAGPLRLGPATAPTVVAQTTTDSARPRERGSARSVAAYREALLAAVVEPSSTAPTSSRASDPTAPATTASAAPVAPRR